MKGILWFCYLKLILAQEPLSLFWMHFLKFLMKLHHVLVFNFFRFPMAKPSSVRCKRMIVTGFEPTTLCFRKDLFLISAVIFNAIFICLFQKAHCVQFWIHQGPNSCPRLRWNFITLEFPIFFIFPGCLGDNRTFFVGELKCQKPAGSCLKTWGRAKNSPLLKIGNYFSITRTPHLKCKNVPVNLVKTNFCYAGIN